MQSRHVKITYVPICALSGEARARRTEPVAAVTLPVLELQGDRITLSYLSDDSAGDRYASAPAYSADLPTGFRALWLRTERISLTSAGHPGGAEVTEVDATEELCRFMGLAPPCYKEFRFYSYFGLGIDAEWLPLPEDAMECSSGGFASLQAGAKAVQRFGDAHGLVPSVPEIDGNVDDDQQPYLLVKRSRLRAVP